MLWKRTIGHNELIRKYRRYICQAGASVADGNEKPLSLLDSKQVTVGTYESRPPSRLKAHLTRS